MTHSNDPAVGGDSTPPRPWQRPGESITIRAFRDEDQSFFRGIVARLRPDATASPRGRAELDRFFQRLGDGTLDQPTDTESFVAVAAAGEPLGVLMLRPDRDHFTGHGRAYVEILVVAAEAEGQGAGAALMRHAEEWARARGLREVALDVFAGNERARAFYERVGYQVDHLRMVKPLVDRQDRRARPDDDSDSG